MHPQPTDDNNVPLEEPRRERQRAEILGLVAAARLHRAADLAHQHLAEFADDRCVQCAVVAALDASADPHVRRRAGEFPAT